MKTYQKRVMERFMSESQLKNFEQEYSDNCNKRGRRSVVTDKDLMILHDYQNGATNTELARKYKTSYWSVNNSLRLAALSKLK